MYEDLLHLPVKIPDSVSTNGTKFFTYLSLKFTPAKDDNVGPQRKADLRRETDSWRAP